jgi:hypothetical protein
VGTARAAAPIRSGETPLIDPGPPFPKNLVDFVR